MSVVKDSDSIFVLTSGGDMDKTKRTLLTRALLIVQEQGIQTIEELRTKTISELYIKANLGRKSVNLIRGGLKLHDLYLAGDEPETVKPSKVKRVVLEVGGNTQLGKTVAALYEISGVIVRKPLKPEGRKKLAETMQKLLKADI